MPVSLYRIKDNFQLIIYLLIEVCQPKTESPLHEIFSIFLYKKGFPSGKPQVSLLQQSAYLNEQRSKYYCYDSHKLDQDVDRRTRRILERIAYGISYNSSLVRVASFSAVMTFFYILLGVVPSSACVGHHDSQQNS